IADNHSLLPPLPRFHPTSVSFLIIPLPPRPTLFPYTTLFRSRLLARTDPTIRRPAAARRPAVSRISWSMLAIAFSSNPILPSLRSEEHTSELQSLTNLVCRLLLEKKKKRNSSRKTVRVSLRI